MQQQAESQLTAAKHEQAVQAFELVASLEEERVTFLETEPETSETSSRSPAATDVKAVNSLTLSDAAIVSPY